MGKGDSFYLQAETKTLQLKSFLDLNLEQCCIKMCLYVVLVRDELGLTHFTLWNGHEQISITSQQYYDLKRAATVAVG